MPKIELLPCPFCGKLETLRMIYLPAEKRECVYHVVCDADSGGCGASTGWNHETPEEAANEWNTRASGWIPCSERLPDPHAKVLFVTFGKSVWCGKYCGIRNGRETWETSKFVSTFWDDEVTHWMPVPDAPAKEKTSQNAAL